MDTVAIRDELSEWIRSMDDSSLLMSLLGIKRATQQSDRAKELSKEERSSIERGLEDLRNGRSIGSKEFWAMHGR